MIPPRQDLGSLGVIAGLVGCHGLDLNLASRDV